MSIISLQYGQCGNQVGGSLISTIYEDIQSCAKKDGDYHSQSVSKWFNVTKAGKWEPRSVIIDTERKTLPTNITPYRFKNIVTNFSGGSANNWAYGYSQQSKLLINEILECVRRELEKCDLLSSLLNVFGSSGGTGSGVGTATIEHLVDEFPNTQIMNAVIVPFSSGEIVIQGYNSLLTLSKIYSISDSTILFENDRLHYNCLNSQHIKDVSFSDINSVISQQLTSLFQPLPTGQAAHLLANLCAHPLFKFLQIRSAPKNETSNNWNSQSSAVARQSRFDFQQQKQTRLNFQMKNLSAALICRGSTRIPNEAELKPLKDSIGNVSWLPSHELMHLYYQPKKLLNLDGHLSMVSNNNSICVPLSQIVEDAKTLFRYRAYLHHYEQYGIEESYFNDAFHILEKVSGDYLKM